MAELVRVLPDFQEDVELRPENSRKSQGFVFVVLLSWMSHRREV